MITTNAIVHCVRRHELHELLVNTGLPITFLESQFNADGDLGPKALIFLLDYLHETIVPVARPNHDRNIAPTDTIIIDVLIPPDENDVQQDKAHVIESMGVGEVELIPSGISVRRVVTLVGGVSASNIISQLRLVCLSAHKLTEEGEDDED